MGSGNKERDDGFMILVSVRDRKFRIELGDGYGLRHNARVEEIASQTIPPYFKVKDYGGGLRKGVEEVAETITRRESWWEWVGTFIFYAALFFSVGIRCAT